MPLKTARFNKYRHKSHPWITGGLLNSLRTKDKLYLKLKKSNNRNDYLQREEAYKQYRNIYNKLIRVSKKLFWLEQFEKYKSDVKQTWKNINVLLNRTKNKDTFPNYFIHENSKIETTQDIAHGFNSYFVNIGPTLASKLNASSINPLSLPSIDLPNSFCLMPTTPQEILSIIDKLKPKSSRSYDDVSPKLLKASDTSISNPLSHIINLSFQNGIFPQAMKIAKIIPIFKDKDNKQFKNYRPISLLPSFSKIIEKLVFYRLLKYLKLNKLLSSCQYGFQPQLSTDMAILDFQNFVANQISQDRWCSGLFLDLSKAFDTLDHNILLGKLSYYGVRGVSLDWFRSYLTNRCQFTSYLSQTSQRLPITCGVPQGSILGPLLFLIYLNDIINICTNSKAILFADDSTMLLEDSSIDILINRMNSAIKILYQWFNANKLSLNADKTKFIIFRSPSRPLPQINPIAVNSKSIERVKSIKFLGVQIDEHLDWREHINKKCNQISKNLAVITRIKHDLPRETIKTLYHSLIYPYLSYGIVTWGNTCSKYMNRLSKLQKRAVRLIVKARYNAHTSPIFKNLRLLTIDDIFKLQCCNLFWKRKHNQLPTLLHEMLETNSEIHSHNTRQNMNIRPRLISKPRYNIQLLSVKVATTWNTLPDSIKNLTHLSLRTFSKKLKFHLIDKYQTTCQIENCYICQ
jgi:hypothetical protein